MTISSSISKVSQLSLLEQRGWEGVALFVKSGLSVHHARTRTPGAVMRRVERGGLVGLADLIGIGETASFDAVTGLACRPWAWPGYRTAWTPA